MCSCRNFWHDQAGIGRRNNLTNEQEEIPGSRFTILSEKFEMLWMFNFDKPQN